VGEWLRSAGLLNLAVVPLSELYVTHDFGSFARFPIHASNRL